jgi:SAM-dependent methyltransferase
VPFPESALAHRLLDGFARGVEIGGSAQNPFAIRGCWNVDYTADPSTVFKQAEREACGGTLRVDVVAVADALPFADGSLDYLIASHVLEHCFDVIGTLEEWLRTIRSGGVLYCIIPHKARTFDKDRPRTKLADLIRRHQRRVPAPSDDARHAHHSVWVTEDFFELCRFLDLELVDFQDVDDKAGNGFTIVVRRTTSTAPEPRLLYAIDRYGCDRDSIYFDGWAHAFEDPVCELWVAAGEVVTPVTRRFARPDVLRAYPAVAGDALPGFSVQANWRPAEPVTLVARTRRGISSVTLELPAAAAR